MMICTVLFALVVAGASAQKIGYGGCPNVPVMTPFDVSKYAGKWYEIEKNPVPFEFGLKCNTAVYEDKGDHVSVVNSGVNKRTGDRSSIEGKATIPDVNVPAKLKVQFDGMPIKGNYWVLDTDYENYSVVYSCFDVLRLFKTEYVWILGRQKTIEEETRTKIYNLLDENKIRRSALTKTVQDCDD